MQAFKMLKMTILEGVETTLLLGTLCQYCKFPQESESPTVQNIPYSVMSKDSKAEVQV